MLQRYVLVVAFCFMGVGAAMAQSGFHRPGIEAWVGSGVQMHASSARDAGGGRAASEKDMNSASLRAGVEATWPIGKAVLGVAIAAPVKEYVIRHDAGMAHRVSKQWQVSFVPGYAFREHVLVYLRVGYGRAGVEVEGVDSLHGRAERTATTLDGLVYGWGARMLFTEHVYGFAEYVQANYRTKQVPVRFTAGSVNQDLSMSRSDFSMGIGIRF